MSGKLYSEEFKIEAVKQVTETRYKVADVADRLGINDKSLYGWIRRYGNDNVQYAEISDPQKEIHRLNPPTPILMKGYSPHTLG